MRGLLELISILPRFERNGQVTKDVEFATPGYWAALSAYCRFKGIKFEDITFYSDKTKGYANAIALENALSGTDNYPYNRKKTGENYSPLVLLSSVDDTDKATSDINSCIRGLFITPELSDFVRDLCDVIGDLHDNVWSHGKSTGFSMAQKWQKYNSSNYCFEFALADCGLGFLRELRRVGLSIENDEEAIEWCITKGNSSKKIKPKDDWVQRLPQDIALNPIQGIGEANMSDNHHMGLGLAKLMDLVNNYKGELWLSTGEKTLIVDNNESKSYINNAHLWQGVALACRFDTGNVKSYIKSDDDITISISEFLGA